MVPLDPRGQPATARSAVLPSAGRNGQSHYVAYVSEQNLLADDTGMPLRHPQIEETFHIADDGHFEMRHRAVN